MPAYSFLLLQNTLTQKGSVRGRVDLPRYVYNYMYHCEFSTLNEARFSQITFPISRVNSHQTAFTLNTSGMIFPTDILRRRWSEILITCLYDFDYMLLWWWRMVASGLVMLSPEKWRKSYNPQIVTHNHHHHLVQIVQCIVVSHHQYQCSGVRFEPHPRAKGSSLLSSSLKYVM